MEPCFLSPGVAGVLGQSWLPLPFPVRDCRPVPLTGRRGFMQDDIRRECYEAVLLDHRCCSISSSGLPCGLMGWRHFPGGRVIGAPGRGPWVGVGATVWVLGKCQPVRGRGRGGETWEENTAVFSNEATARSFPPVDRLPSWLRMTDGEATAPRR